MNDPSAAAESDPNSEQNAAPDASAVLPENDAAEMTPEQLAEAQQYGWLSLLCDLADKGLDLAFLAVVALVVAVPLDRWLEPSIPSFTLRLAAIFAVTTLAHVVISFPLSFYAGYSLEHRFALSHQTLGRWLMRYAKRNGLALAFGLVLVTALYWIIWLDGLLVVAGGGRRVFCYYDRRRPARARADRAAVLQGRADRKRRALRAHGPARRRHRPVDPGRLSARPQRRNGQGQRHARRPGRTRRVLMGDTLLDQFSPDEIEVIFAHEIGHHVFRHIRKMIVTGLIYSVIGFWVCDRVAARLGAKPVRARHGARAAARHAAAC